MTALAAPIFAPAVWPDWRRLVSIERAAERLELSERHLTRICSEDLERRVVPLAYYGTHPNGGQAKWFVCCDYDTRLVVGPVGDAWAEPDLSNFSKRQREAALQRRACVEAFQHAQYRGHTSRDQVQRLIEELSRKYPTLKISRSAIYSWSKVYRRPADTLNLIDNRGGNQMPKADCAAWSMFRDLFLHQNQPSARRCWREVNHAASEKGWRWCSYDACIRQLDERIPIQDQVKARQPERYRTELAPFISQDPEAWAANECWIGDHKQLDLICRFSGKLIRPWLSTWMDWRTRCVVGYVLSDEPNSTTILAALRHGLMDEANYGGPRVVWVDNGKDYTAWMFHGATKAQRRAEIRPQIDEPRAHGIFNALSIEAHFATAYNPNGKARLERWFRTLESFCKTFDTYTGDCIENKPERLNEILKNPRLIPTFETIRARIADHISGKNARTDHGIDDLSDDGMTISPNEAMQRWCDSRRMHQPGVLDLLLMNWHKPVTVTRNGIAICLGGRTLHYGQFEQALSPFKAISKADRRPVLIAFDPHDLRTIRVHDENWKHICTATMNQVGGMHGTDAISVEHVKTIARNKASYEKGRKHVAEHSLTQICTTEEQLAHAAAQANTPTPPPTSPMKMVQTPMDGEAKYIDRDNVRAAVGAESMSPPTRRSSLLDRLKNIQQTPMTVPSSTTLANALLKLRNQGAYHE